MLFQQQNLLRNLLLDVARVYPDIISQDFVNEITLSIVLDDLDAQSDNSSSSKVSADDILRFGLDKPRFELGPKAQQRLEEELDRNILSTAEYFHADVDWENLGDEERDRLMWSLPDDIASLRASTESARSEVTTTYARLEDLMNVLQEAHTRLQASLSSLISKHPPNLNSRRTASTELLATRIEASLIKLSLIRARATQALYEHRSGSTSVADALSSAHAKLKADEKRMREEEKVLDQQLAEYDEMLKLVDGGGFRQVIEDWARVQREREECVRDLRRLGWTGD